MGGEIRYCITDDGVRIAYRVKGEGPPLVVAPFFMESFSLLHRMPSLSQFLDRLAEGRTLIQYDTRGTGLSQRGSKDFSPRALAADIAAVVRDVGERQIMVWGSHGGTIRGMAFAIYYPELVFKLAMYTPLPVNTAYFPVQALHAMASLWRTDPKTAARNMADAAMREQQPALALQMARLLEESVEGESVARFLESAAGGEWDLLDALSSITAPSLIVHRTGDQTPFEMARKTSELIPNSRLVQIDSPPFLDDPFELLRVVDGFLDKQSVETDGPQSWPGVFRTVLVTDLVSHTAMMSRLGDDRGRAVLREHERITRDVLKANGGTEVKTMGDGFMASFGSVTRAVECGVALQRALAERDGEPLSVRVGLNAGEPIEEEGDLFGATVILASRIAARAEGGEILVADTVRGLCSGKGFLFADRGEFVAKGFEEPVRVYEVRWRDDS